MKIGYIFYVRVVWGQDIQQRAFVCFFLSVSRVYQQSRFCPHVGTEVLSLETGLGLVWEEVYQSSHRSIVVCLSDVY